MMCCLLVTCCLEFSVAGGVYFLLFWILPANDFSCARSLAVISGGGIPAAEAAGNTESRRSRNEVSGLEWGGPQV